ncbi:MAG: M15 family metallopeptidase [Bacteroidia bacterium]|nr:M15 family metallopeptidase [Bacteroidia bacterium]
MIFNENRLTGIRPEVQEAVRAIAQRTENELKRNITVSEGFRTFAVQEAYYAQGRKGLEEVNALRKKAGLPAITKKQNQKIVTYAPAGTSAHNVSAAVDIYLLTADNKSLESNTAMLTKFFAIVSEEVLKRKDTVVWGGHWKDFKDMPHIEYKHYRSLIKNNPVVSNDKNNTDNTDNTDNTLLILGAVVLMGLVLLS